MFLAQIAHRIYSLEFTVATMFMKDPPKNESTIQDHVLKFQPKSKKKETEEEEGCLTGEEVEVVDTPVLPEMERVTLPDLDSPAMQTKLAMSKAFWILGAGGLMDDGKLKVQTPPTPEEIARRIAEQQQGP
jgi:hypothetical protein